MLSLVASYHVYGLLQEIKVEVLVAERRREVKVPIYEGLGTRIEQSVNIGLVPASLLYGLELAVEVV